MAEKTVFLAAAYHTDGTPLSGLVTEIRLIEDALRPLHERGLYEVLSNRAANTNDVFQVFSKRKTGIVLFHYAGHANQKELHLEGGGLAKGIAGLFGLTQGKHLKVVFLNGCASYGLVRNLHEAGVGAVIATARPVEDETATVFAEAFYKQWSVEETTLDVAFETAKNRAAAFSDDPNRAVAHRDINVEEPEPTETAVFPWGLYLNPAAPEAERAELLQMCLNPRPQLPTQRLLNVKTRAMESLQELLYEFKATDEEARAELEQDEQKDALLVLITRLPWMIGTHLRRLFALEESRSMAEPGAERLWELTEAYTELSRFLSYLSLSALWDDRQKQEEAARFAEAQIPLWAQPEGQLTDYIHLLRQCHAILKAIPGDPIALEAHIEDFLHVLDGELSECYRFMEELRVAFADPARERLGQLVEQRTGKADGLAEVCLQAEAIFARFLQAALFLTRYKLYSVRSISVDKIRLLDMAQPFVHRTMLLHAAFGDIKLMPTPRADASDNYCILLAPRQQDGKDPLKNALNISPFYLDRNAFLSQKSDQYPAIFVLDAHKNGQEFRYSYIDKDVNHDYAHAEDLHFTVKKFGGMFPAALGIAQNDAEKFIPVYRQLIKLHQDFQK
jgi:hypothetical protein